MRASALAEADFAFTKRLTYRWLPRHLRTGRKIFRGESRIVSPRRARKVYSCSDCHEAIRPGDSYGYHTRSRYVRLAGRARSPRPGDSPLYTAEVMTDRYCAGCLQVRPGKRDATALPEAGSFRYQALRLVS